MAPFGHKTITNFGVSPIKKKIGPPPAFSGIELESFNKCINAINVFIKLTLRSKTASISLEKYPKVIKLAKLLGFNSEFYKKQFADMNQFIKTKDFLVILRVRIHSLMNAVI
jgi:hypothetical protein